MSDKKHILVIGAGASGLAAIKSCKEESLDVICYEKTKYCGGKWHYNEHSTTGDTSIMKSTVCKSSKEIGAFSDFPPPSDFPNYMHHTKMLCYLTLYAQKFDLLQNIVYEREVIWVAPSSQFKENGKWSVTSENCLNKSQITEDFDGILVCSGHLSNPRVPEYPEKDKFQGIILHAQLLKNISMFENLKILVVGSGNSAVDAAVEISTVADQVYLSTRNGFWLFPKVGPKGLPYDTFLLRRDVRFLKSICSPLVNNYTEKYLQSKINHDIYKIRPDHRALDKHPTINDDLPDKILTGRVIIKSSISRFAEQGVFFEQEEHLTELDGVIFATGCDMNLPFLDNSLYRNESGSLKLYKKVFPIDLKTATLGFIGYVESFGPKIPISESQSRWAARVLSKKSHLPLNETIQRKTNHLQVKGNANELFEDYISYMDELAEEYGVKPEPCLFFKDLTLFRANFMGPFLPYQYRLVGPHCSSDARNFILESSKRIKQPLKTRFS